MGNVLKGLKHQETKLQWSSKTGRGKQEKMVKLNTIWEE